VWHRNEDSVTKSFARAKVSGVGLPLLGGGNELPETRLPEKLCDIWMGLLVKVYQNMWRWMEKTEQESVDSTDKRRGWLWLAKRKISVQHEAMPGRLYHGQMGRLEQM
jgi:hypothetical protein